MARALLSFFQTSTRGPSTFSNASVASSRSASMPAVVACATMMSPKRSTVRPGKPSLSPNSSR